MGWKSYISKTHHLEFCYSPRSVGLVNWVLCHHEVLEGVRVQLGNYLTWHTQHFCSDPGLSPDPPGCLPLSESFAVSGPPSYFLKKEGQVILNFHFRVSVFNQPPYASRFGEE